MASSTANPPTTPEGPPRLATLAHFIVHHRRAVIVAWAVLTIFGAFSASQVSKRWFESFSIPGYSSYEANQRTLQTFGTGEQAPLVAVFHSTGDVTKATGIKDAISAAANVNKGSRVSSYWSTGSRAYVSEDGHTAFAEIYPVGCANPVSPRNRPFPHLTSSAGSSLRAPQGAQGAAGSRPSLALESEPT